MTISQIELIQKIGEESTDNAQELAKILKDMSISKALDDKIKNIGRQPFSYLQQQTVVKVEEDIITTLKLKCKFSSLRTKIRQYHLREFYDYYVTQFWNKLKEDIEKQRKTIYQATLESAKKNLEEIHKQLEMGEIHNALAELIAYIEKDDDSNIYYAISVLKYISEKLIPNAKINHATYQEYIIAKKDMGFGVYYYPSEVKGLPGSPDNSLSELIAILAGISLIPTLAFTVVTLALLGLPHSITTAFLSYLIISVVVNVLLTALFLWNQFGPKRQLALYAEKTCDAISNYYNSHGYHDIQIEILISNIESKFQELLGLEYKPNIDPIPQQSNLITLIEEAKKEHPDQIIKLHRLISIFDNITDKMQRRESFTPLTNDPVFQKIIDAFNLSSVFYMYEINKRHPMRVFADQSLIDTIEAKFLADLRKNDASIYPEMIKCLQDMAKTPSFNFLKCYFSLFSGFKKSSDLEQYRITKCASYGQV